MNSELYERVLLERVEMIARLACDGVCKEGDREIALNLIAEIAKVKTIKHNEFPMCCEPSLQSGDSNHFKE